jgi:hypothetical protein
MQQRYWVLGMGREHKAIYIDHKIQLEFIPVLIHEKNLRNTGPSSLNE